MSVEPRCFSPDVQGSSGQLGDGQDRPRESSWGVGREPAQPRISRVEDEIARLPLRQVAAGVFRRVEQTQWRVVSGVLAGRVGVPLAHGRSAPDSAM